MKKSTISLFSTLPFVEAAHPARHSSSALIRYGHIYEVVFIQMLVVGKAMAGDGWVPLFILRYFSALRSKKLLMT
jgi:hypothetical protein